MLHYIDGKPIGTPAELAWERASFCGCGAQQETMRYLLGLLDYIAEKRFDWAEMERRLPGGDGSYLPLYALDAMGLTEHGGNVGGSWLTDEGERLRRWLHATPEEAWFPDDIMEPEEMEALVTD